MGRPSRPRLVRHDEVSCGCSLSLVSGLPGLPGPRGRLPRRDGGQAAGAGVARLRLGQLGLGDDGRRRRSAGLLRRNGRAEGGHRAPRLPARRDGPLGLRQQRFDARRLPHRADPRRDRRPARRAARAPVGVRDRGRPPDDAPGLLRKGRRRDDSRLYALSQFAFVSANVFYDSFLPHLAKEEELDRLSARGFAVGYVGGSVHFVLALVLMATHARWGLSAETAARIALSSAGLWWAGFGAITFLGLKEPERRASVPGSFAPCATASPTRSRRRAGSRR